MEKERDGAMELLKHEHCLRSVPNCDRLKRVKSSKALGAVGVPKTGKNKVNLRTRDVHFRQKMQSVIAHKL